MIYGVEAVQAANNRCFMCEQPVAGDHWFAQVKHGHSTIRLCCAPCAQHFFGHRLPVLCRAGVRAVLGSLAWRGVKRK